MKVGILGTGQVGQSLARGFEKYGHEVRLGSRDPARPYADAARFGGGIRRIGRRASAALAARLARREGAQYHQWITIGIRRGRWDHAWKLLRKEDA